MPIKTKRPLNQRRPHFARLQPLVCLILLLLFAPLPIGTVNGAPENSATRNVSDEANPAVNPYLWNTQRVEAPKLFYNMSDHSLRSDASGYPHLAYGGDHLYYTHFSSSGWLFEKVDDSYGVGQYASLDLDKNAWPHISYYDSLNGSLKYAHYDGNEWFIDVIDQPGTMAFFESEIPGDNPIDPIFTDQIYPRNWQSPHLQTGSMGALSPQQATAGGGTGLYTSIAVDSKGYPHISYYNKTSHDLMYATNASGTWTITTVNQSDDVGKYSSIALDSDDTPHISYLDDTFDRLKYATRSDGRWVTSVIDEQDLKNIGGYSSIAVDDNDKPHISYYLFDEIEKEGALRYARMSGDTWIKYTVDDPTDGNVGGYTSIAIDNNNRAHISYYDFDEQNLKRARWTGNSWSISEVVNNGEVGPYTSIMLDLSNYAHIAYLDNEYGALKEVYWGGSQWQDPRVVDNYRDVGLSTSMALDSLDNPFISYYNDTTDDLKFANKLPNGSWQVNVVDYSDDVGLYSSLAIANDLPYIAYYDASQGNLKYASWTGFGWAYNTVDTNDDVGQYPSLAFDIFSNPHICYYDATNKNLKYAYWNGSQWDFQIVDETGDVGMYTSMAFDSNNIAHISYYDATNQDLKLAKWTGSTWDIQTLDSAGEVGQFTSLALDQSGIPHISYYDATNRDLKYINTIQGVSQVVDASGEVGMYTSILVDNADIPSISYYDDGNQDLKFAQWRGNQWVLQTVDSLGEVGMYSSLVMDSTGNFHISYYDHTNGDLKIASSITATNQLYLPMVLD